MAPETLTAPSTLTITITDTPRLDDLQLWWHARQTDPDSAIAFTDDAPQDFAGLYHRIVTGDYLFYLARDCAGQIVGAMWLHDLVRGADDTPRAGWLGTYVLTTCRGVRTTQAMWTLTREALEARGVRSVYIASHHTNTRAHRVAEYHLGFYKVDVFPAFALFGGTPTDCLILSMRREDMAEAWAMAYIRSCRPAATPVSFSAEPYALEPSLGQSSDGLIEHNGLTLGSPQTTIKQ
jgi:RimJ/RimL family protein N-acetyltransferase